MTPGWISRSGSRLRLPVENLPTGGRIVAFSLADAWAKESAGVALETEPTALEGTLEVQRASDRPDAADLRRAGRLPPGLVGVLVRAEARGERACDRCTEPVQLALQVETPLSYLPLVPTEAPEKSADEDEDELVEEEDLDVGWYTNGEIDLAAVLREALALALPVRVVCADVPACNARTEALLQAASPPAPGPFAALAKLKNPPSKSN
jgi:uncharacterized metal-binding protein YceD (DUF177 family)